MRPASMRQAEWIYKQLDHDIYKETADDVYDVLLGNITSPADFVADVQSLAIDYEDDLRRNNGR
jgi:hypothetical protein